MIYRLFYPVVPVLVVAKHGSQVSGLTAIWYCPLSFNPPTIGVSLSPNHQTYKLLTRSRRFSLCWLDVKHSKSLDFVGRISASQVKNKIVAAGLSVIAGKEGRTPMVREAVAVLDCRLKKKIRFGTHDLLVGFVASAYSSRDFQEYWKYKSYHPAIYTGTDVKGRSVFRTLAE